MMTDIATLQTELMAAIDSADTLDTLEAVRISALGKQGSVSALLKTMGAMSPDERQTQGPIINGLRESVTAALAAKKAALETAELNRRLASEYVDMTLPAPEAPRGTSTFPKRILRARCMIHSISPTKWRAMAAKCCCGRTHHRCKSAP